MTAVVIRLMGLNFYFLFCSEAYHEGISPDGGILLSACYHEQ